AQPQESGWYDGRDHRYTLVAAPDGGSRLPDARLLALVKRWLRKESTPIPWLLLPVAALLLVAAAALAFWLLRSPALPTSPAEHDIVFGYRAPRHLLGELKSGTTVRFSPAAFKDSASVQLTLQLENVAPDMAEKMQVRIAVNE